MESFIITEESKKQRFFFSEPFLSRFLKSNFIVGMMGTTEEPWNKGLRKVEYSDFRSFAKLRIPHFCIAWNSNWRETRNKWWKLTKKPVFLTQKQGFITYSLQNYHFITETENFVPTRSLGYEFGMQGLTII